MLRAIELGGWVASRGWWHHNNNMKHGLGQWPNSRLRNEPPRNKLKCCACEGSEGLTGSWHWTARCPPLWSACPAAPACMFDVGMGNTCR